MDVTLFVPCCDAVGVLLAVDCWLTVREDVEDLVVVKLGVCDRLKVAPCVRVVVPVCDTVSVVVGVSETVGDLD